MNKREKVLSGLQHCLPITEEDGQLTCDTCPYYKCDESVKLPIALIEDIRNVLKDVQPVKPLVEKAIYDYQSWHYVCGVCGGQIDIQDQYCRHCGIPVEHWSNMQ